MRLNAVPFSAFTYNRRTGTSTPPRTSRPLKEEEEEEAIVLQDHRDIPVCNTNEEPANENLGCLWAATSLITVMNENTRVCVARAPIKSGFAFNVHHLNG